MGTGMQDAVNLGWKLAHVVQGAAPDDLLGTYHDERHPVAARVLQNTQAQALLGRTDARHLSLKNILGELTEIAEVRHRLFAMLAALDVRYDLGGEHPLVGRRMPDVDLTTADGATRVYALLHDARPVLLRLGPGAPAFDSTAWPHLKAVDATGPHALTLPLLGEVAAPSAVLIRPDGYVGWCA
jgi:3-(3-hydroxy-phenyl)propionate hydroxylase